MKRIKMKRSAQLGIGFCVILASLTFLGLTQGWYFSSQICTEDSLRGLYFDPEEKIAEVQVGNKIRSQSWARSGKASFMSRSAVLSTS